VIGLDKAHSPHVSSQVERVIATSHGLFAVGQVAQVHQLELVTEVVLVKVLILLPVSTHHVVPFLFQPLGNV